VTAKGVGVGRGPRQPDMPERCVVKVKVKVKRKQALRDDVICALLKASLVSSAATTSAILELWRLPRLASGDWLVLSGCCLLNHHYIFCYQPYLRQQEHLP
jgi:hypothetical protein